MGRPKIYNIFMNMILTCSSLKDHIDAAQQAMGTSWPVTVVDRSHHVEPAEMKQVICAEIEEMAQAFRRACVCVQGPGAVPLPPEETLPGLTVLVAMGFCGGAWDHVSFPCRVVIPRVDDCISLLLATDDTCVPNRKEIGHLYLYENDPADFSALHLLRDGGTADETYRGMSREDLFRYWFGNYHAMDIIDTGLNTSCYDVEYAQAAQKEADMINAALGYVQGSNRMLEKLVSGRWDKQFIVAEPGQVIKHSDFFE